MLIDQDNPNVLSLRRKPLKRSLYSGIVCLDIYYEKVLLVVGWCRDMLSSERVRVHWERGSGEKVRTPMPARSSPVTESYCSARLLEHIPGFNSLTRAACLVPDHGQEFPVPEVCLRRHVGCG
jgi:hypothetical protein